MICVSYKMEGMGDDIYTAFVTLLVVSASMPQ